MSNQKLKIDNKGFAVFALLFGIIGLLIMAHHIVSYENILRPFMDYLIDNRIITNDKSGVAFLRMFTNESNILVDIWLVLFALGIFGNKKLYALTHKEWLRGAITLNIAVTGIIYFTVLLPSSQPFPTEVNGVSTGGMWFSNVVNYWDHLITPVFFTACWFFPVEERKIPKVKYGLIYLIYPICYFIVCIILGAHDGFYPYPFLSGRQMCSMLPGLRDQPYNPVTGTLLLVAVVIVLSGVFFGIGCALNAIHNKRVKVPAQPEEKE
ncbi:MAG: Pr6Pr family membrane protein [Clostridia bacterium]|nr:Pr6Pr family membrane protein [Clostridia bacterium]